MKPLASLQRGMTVIGLVVILGFAGFIAVITMKVVPIYSANFTLSSTLDTLASTAGMHGKPDHEVYKDIERRFNISYVDILQPKDIKIAKKGGSRYLVVDYEDRRNVLSNLDVVVHFQQEFMLSR